MNKLPEVKRFIDKKAKYYQNLEVKYVGGDPRVKLFDAEGIEIAEDKIDTLTEAEIMEYFQSKGFNYDPSIEETIAQEDL